MSIDSEETYDSIIIGGGPAGMSAAIWCADLGLSAVLVEKNNRLGGQLWDIHSPVVNYPGVLSTTGAQLANQMISQVETSGSRVLLNAEIVNLDVSNHSVTLADGTKVRGRSIILASGVRRRKLGVPGEEDFVGKGILTSGALERDKVAGARVLIIGGGDAALENAVMLSKTAHDVTVVHRGHAFSARREFITAAESQRNIRFAFRAKVLEFVGRERLEQAAICNDKHEAEQISVDFALIRIGVEPNSDIPGVSQPEAGSYIEVDSAVETRRPMIFAVGDVANQASPTIATAVGMGAAAAKNLLRRIAQRR